MSDFLCYNVIIRNNYCIFTVSTCTFLGDEMKYLWKETIKVLNFLHKNNYQRKITSKSNAIGWVW